MSVWVLVEGVSDEQAYAILLERARVTPLPQVFSVRRRAPSGNHALIKPSVVEGFRALARREGVARLVIVKDGEGRGLGIMRGVYAPVTALAGGPPRLRPTWVDTDLEGLLIADWDAALRYAQARPTVPKPIESAKCKFVVEWLLTTRGEEPYPAWRAMARGTVRYRPMKDGVGLARQIDVRKLTCDRSWRRLLRSIERHRP